MANDNRLISTEKLKKIVARMVELPADVRVKFIAAINQTPTVDAVDVVRCKECRFAKFESKCSKYYCLHFPASFRYSNDFCSYGERRRDE